MARQAPFKAITSAGGILPADLLARIADPKGGAPGLAAADYHVAGEQIRDRINRSWSRLQGAWASFREARSRLSEHDPGTTETRERLLLPLFEELGYGRLQTRRAITVDAKSYAISHRWTREHVLFHLLGCNIHLHKASRGVRGAAGSSPHSIVQDLLNRSDDHLWAFLTNGLTLRILRDHASLTRQAYVEFDLESIFEGSLFSEFSVLWLVCHQSRVETEEPEDCWLERWFEFAREEGVRAREGLREGVQEAIERLGAGFIAHGANTALRERLRSGELTGQDYYRQLLRLVYRLIFLFVAEDRDVLLRGDATEAQRALYTRWYSTGSMRERSLRRRGGPHIDLWEQVRLVMSKLHDGCPQLGLAGLGSWLWRDDEAIPDLRHASLTNRFMLAAVRSLCRTKADGVVRPTDWKNLDAEELGSVYEALLELQPDMHLDAAKFELVVRAGNDRKTSGSYYTPTVLIDLLLDSALEPLIRRARRERDPEAALLELKVCDPACGSGHFLLGAARRLAKALARLRSGDVEPPPDVLQHALRDVIGRCIYGVDLNPMAVELCKVSLWMEAVEPGQPLPFLEAHVLAGNALMGATPKGLSEGVPNEAFNQTDGDDKDVLSRLRSRNREELKGQTSILSLLAGESRPPDYLPFAARARAIEARGASSVAEVRQKEASYQAMLAADDYRREWMTSDAWCAAFVEEKTPEMEPLVVTHDRLRLVSTRPQDLPESVHERIRENASRYGFFHWPTAFPTVFSESRGEPHPETGWPGGFDAILGNPPWDEIQFEETAWFASRNLEVAEAPNQKTRKKLIAALEGTDPALFARYKHALRKVDSTKLFVRKAGRYPRGASGKLNTYVLFTEAAHQLTRPTGRVGIVVPTGLGTDLSTQDLFEYFASAPSIVSFLDFVNERPFFPEVRPHQRFCLLTLVGRGERAEQADVAAFLRHENDLEDPARTYPITWEDILRFNPGAPSMPLFSTPEARSVFSKLVTRCAPFEAPEAEWEPHYKQGTFNTASASGLFKTARDLSQEGCLEACLNHESGAPYLPLFDAKMGRQFQWRAASLGFSGHQFRKISKTSTDEEQLRDPDFVPEVAYWVQREEAESRLDGWEREWLLGFKEVTGTTSTRMASFSVVPRWGVAHKFPIVRLAGDAPEHAVILSWLNSLLVELVLRYRMQGVSLTKHLLWQVPTPTRAMVRGTCAWLPGESFQGWLLPRVAELSVTARPLTAFLDDLGCPGAPFRFDPERRVQLRAELEAGWFSLLGFDRTELAYVLDFLTKVQAADERRWGSYRTKELVLEAFDEMAEATREGRMARSLLDPPPASTAVRHPSRDD